jgi:HSP20 family protein
MDVKKTEGLTPQTTGEAKPSSIAVPFLSLREDLDRLFDNFFLSPFSRRFLDVDSLRRWGVHANGVTPRMDVVETEDNIEVSAELPGIAEADIDVSIAEGMITIRGEKKLVRDNKKGDLHLSERSFGTFTRSFRMPDNVDDENITATFDKGVLLLSMPKKEKVQPHRKKIAVHSKH